MPSPSTIAMNEEMATPLDPTTTLLLQNESELALIKEAYVELEQQVNDLKSVLTILARDRDEAILRGDRMLIENNTLLEQTRKLKRVAEAAQWYLAARRLLVNGLSRLTDKQVHDLADLEADLEQKLLDAGYEDQGHGQADR